MRILLVILFHLLSFIGTAQQVNETLSAYPNPFKDTTEITLENLSNDTVTLAIYDIYGSIVSMPFNSTILSGTVTSTFKADTLPDGMYLVSLLMNQEREAIRIEKSPNPTGVLAISENPEEVILYPNPVMDWLKVSTTERIKQINLYDAQGKLVMKQDALLESIYLNSLEAGLYYIQIETESSYHQRSIIKK